MQDRGKRLGRFRIVEKATGYPAAQLELMQANASPSQWRAFVAVVFERRKRAVCQGGGHYRFKQGRVEYNPDPSDPTQPWAVCVNETLARRAMAALEPERRPWVLSGLVLG